MNDGNQIAVFIDFENLALWAEREFFDFEITPLIEYLQTRGPAVVKRAYGDWSRFSRYRDDLMNNSIDLIQIYSVRGSKNRADIRMAIDAFEISMTRPQINTYVIVSGDSDFGPLVVKLREYGRYIIGIGPRSITHHLLVKSCDEFVYLETAFGETTETDESCAEREEARTLITKALQVHGQRGELPVLATRLKQTMLLLDPAFNEANFGYSQFRSWLEDNRDLVKLFIKDLQLYTAPIDFSTPIEVDATLTSAMPQVIEVTTPVKPSLETHYRNMLARIKPASIEMATRRDILRDIYRELLEHPGGQTPEELLEILYDRYEVQGMPRSKTTIHDVIQMCQRQRIFDYHENSVSMASPIWLVEGITSEAEFICRAEADLVYAIVKAGIEIDPSELAYVLFNDRSQVDYVHCMLDNLKQRNLITKKGKGFSLPGSGVIPFENESFLEVLFRDIGNIQIPSNVEVNFETAHSLAKKAMLQRSQDFVASGNNYLMACRVQWEAVEMMQPGATQEDLKWFMASYASVIAGKLSQVNRDYAGARPYYLAFFALVQESDPLWGRMRGLINPMLSYYWANAGKELDINISSWNLSMSSPAQIANMAANHPDQNLQKLWANLTIELAKVNPGILRRIANQLYMNRNDGPESTRTAEIIDEILVDHAPL
jgi:uncharacterized LabA/DUF88 family protein